MTNEEKLKKRIEICESALVNVVRGATMDGTSERFSYKRLNQIASEAVRASWALRPKPFKRATRPTPARNKRARR